MLAIEIKPNQLHITVNRRIGRLFCRFITHEETEGTRRTPLLYGFFQNTFYRLIQTGAESYLSDQEADEMDYDQATDLLEEWLPKVNDYYTCPWLQATNVDIALRQMKAHIMKIVNSLKRLNIYDDARSMCDSEKNNLAREFFISVRDKIGKRDSSVFDDLKLGLQNEDIIYIDGALFGLKLLIEEGYWETFSSSCEALMSEIIHKLSYYDSYVRSDSKACFYKILGLKKLELEQLRCENNEGIEGPFKDLPVGIIKRIQYEFFNEYFSFHTLFAIQLTCKKLHKVTCETMLEMLMLKNFQVIKCPFEGNHYPIDRFRGILKGAQNFDTLVHYLKTGCKNAMEQPKAYGDRMKSITPIQMILEIIRLLVEEDLLKESSILALLTKLETTIISNTDVAKIVTGKPFEAVLKLISPDTINELIKKLIENLNLSKDCNNSMYILLNLLKQGFLTAESEYLPAIEDIVPSPKFIKESPKVVIKVLWKIKRILQQPMLSTHNVIIAESLLKHMDDYIKHKNHPLFNQYKMQEAIDSYKTIIKKIIDSEASAATECCQLIMEHENDDEDVKDLKKYIVEKKISIETIDTDESSLQIEGYENTHAL